MKRPPPLFVIGSLGMLVTATMHWATASNVVDPGQHSPFLPAYPVFLAFVAIGAVQCLRRRSGS